MRPRLRSTLSYLAPFVLVTPALLLPCLAHAKVASQDPAYTHEMAQADLKLVIEGGGREYLQARARLGDHVSLAHEVSLAALEALDRRAATLAEAGATSSDAEIERERGRIIVVLAQAKDPADAPRFGKRLRAVLDRPEAQEDWQVLLEPWHSLLMALGPAAVPEFTKLVADRSLDPAQREFFLSDLVEVTPEAQLDPLCAQLGQGDIGLEHALRRALRRRARNTKSGGKELVATLSAQFQNAQLAPSLRAASLLLRQSITALAPDQELQLVQLALDESASFELRAAALLVLGDTPAERAKLEELAAANLAPERRDDQQAELLAWLSMQTLEAQGQARLDSRFDLRSAASPRLAILAWRSAELDSTADWLDSALTHPWPEVRREAVGRVGAGCSRSARDRLRTLSGPKSGGGEPSEQFARATVSALGRCGDTEGLRTLVEHDGIGFERRGVVARALVRHDPSGPAFVAKLLAKPIDPHLGEQFATALGETPSALASQEIIDALCHAEAINPSAAASARRSRKKLSPTASCPTQ